MKIATTQLTALLMLFSLPLFAQQPKVYKTKFGGLGKSIVLNVDAKQLDIEGYNGNEVIIEGTNIPPIPKEAEGLRPISAYKVAGVENTGIGLSVYEQGNTLQILSVLKGEEIKYKIKIPKELNIVNKKSTYYHNNDAIIKIENIEGSIECASNQETVEMVNVTGPIVTSSNFGRIKIVFKDDISPLPSSIMAFGNNSSVDITVSEKSNIVFSVASTTGNMFTDLDLKPYTPPAKVEENKKAHATDTTIEIEGLATDGIVTGKPNSVTLKGQAELSLGDDTWGKATTVKGKDLEIVTWADNERNNANYVLNEPKTNITIYPTKSNVYLRKKK